MIPSPARWRQPTPNSPAINHATTGYRGRPTARSCTTGPVSRSSPRVPETARSPTTRMSGWTWTSCLRPASSTPRPPCTSAAGRITVFDYRSMFDLSGKTALVVGAGSGIGAASAEGLAAFGARVFCADLDAESAESTVRDVRNGGGEGEALALDIRDAKSVREVVGQIGTPDVLVSTPSINVRKPLLEITDEEFDRVVELNLKGTFRLVREFGRGMAERGSGSIIAFSSIRAQVVEPG